MTTTLLIVFFSVMIGIGIYCRKHATDVNGFVLGGRSVGPWITAFAYGTSYFSAVIFVGYAGQFGWNFGLASTWIGLGNAFLGSLLAWTVLGRRTRIMSQHLDCKTMPDFFGKRFSSPKIKVLAAVITFLFLIPYTASLYNGLSRLFSIAYPGLDYSVCVIIMAVLTAAYVLFGGYMATAINDFVQGIIMLFGIVVVVLSVLRSNGGFMQAVETLATSENGGWQYTSFFGPQPLFLLFVVLLTSLGTWGLPQMVSKFYAIKNENSIKKGTIISTVFALVVAGGCYFLGGFGRLFPVDVAKEGYDAVIPTMLSQFPSLLIALVIVLVLSASMSTLSSLVLTSASTITLDFIEPLGRKSFHDKKRIGIIRLFVLVFIVISSVIAIAQYHSHNLLIAQLMGVSWGALAGAFLAPFLYGLYWRKTTKAATVCCFIFGVSVELVQLAVSLGWIAFSKGTIPAFVFQNSLYSGVIAMLSGLVLVPLISWLTKKENPQDVDRIFSCYRAVKSVDITDSLGE